MKASSVSKFLAGVISAEVFSREIRDEVQGYREGLLQRQTSVPVELAGDHSAIQVRASGIIRICNSLLSRELSLWDTHYLCDALGLSEASFSSERIREIVEDFGNPEINTREFSFDEIHTLRNELSAQEI